MGVKTPRNIRSTAKRRVVNRSSLKADGRKNCPFRGGRRARIGIQESRRRAKIMKPDIRTVHPNPKRGSLNIWLRAMGKMTPPRDDPATAMPMAAPRLSLKYWPIAAIAGAILIPIEILPRTPLGKYELIVRLTKACHHHRDYESDR